MLVDGLISKSIADRAELALYIRLFFCNTRKSVKGDPERIELRMGSCCMEFKDLVERVFPSTRCLLGPKISHHDIRDFALALKIAHGDFFQALQSVIRSEYSESKKPEDDESDERRVQIENLAAENSELREQIKGLATQLEILKARSGNN